MSGDAFRVECSALTVWKGFAPLASNASPGQGPRYNENIVFGPGHERGGNRRNVAH